MGRMNLQIGRVPSVACEHCGGTVKLSQARPLSTRPCPHCEKKLLVPGRVGEYRILRLLGRGAVGAVFEGVDEQHERPVAVKVIAPRRTGSEDLSDYLAEARALARIHHRNVVQVHAVGEYRDQPFIVMELVEGAQRLDPKQPMRESQAIDVLIQVAEGLAVAAEANLMHGDIKPQNILLNRQGVAKIVDFGLSERAARASAGTVWGTPYYIAPERARGKPGDLRSDMYSLGATMWHMVTGSPPFDGARISDVLRARLTQPTPKLQEHMPEIHTPFAALIYRMMGRTPDQRFDDYGELLEQARVAQMQIASASTDALPHSAIADALVEMEPTLGDPPADAEVAPGTDELRLPMGDPGQGPAGHSKKPAALAARFPMPLLIGMAGLVLVVLVVLIWVLLW